MVEYLRHDVTMPLQGMDAITRPLQLPPELSPNLINASLNRGDVRQRPGLFQLGNTVFQRDNTAAANKEFPISVFSVERDTILETFVFTRAQGFRFLSTAADLNQGVWEHITPKVAVGGGVTFDFTNDDTIVPTNIDPTGQVAVGDFIKPDSESNRQFWGEVASIQSGTPSVTLVAVYAGVSTGAGAATSKQVFFTGTDSDPWSMAVNRGDAYATQGVEKIHKYNGTGEFTEVATSVPAKHIIMFNRRLILAHTFEGGGFQPARVKWSAIGAPEDFTSITSGFEDLTIVPDSINQILAGRNVFAIYRENAIQTASNTGAVEAPFAFSHPVIGIGGLGRSAIAVGDVHFFMGRDNVYMFDMITPRPIGERVRPDLENINFSRKAQIFGHYNPRTREYQLFVPLGSTKYASDVLVYYIPNQAWTKWNIPDLTGTPSGSTGTMTATSTHISQATDIWDSPSEVDVPLESDPSLDWDQDAVPWNTIPASSTPIGIVTTLDGTVNMLDAAFTNDKTRDIIMTVETKDFDLADVVEGLRRFDLKTLTRIRVTYDDLGTPFDLEAAISVDGGIVFGDAEVKSVGGASGRREVFFDTWITGRSFRIRFRKLTGNIHPRFVELGLQFIYRGKLRIAAA